MACQDPLVPQGRPAIPLDRVRTATPTTCQERKVDVGNLLKKKVTHEELWDAQRSSRRDMDGSISNLIKALGVVGSWLNFGEGTAHPVPRNIGEEIDELRKKVDAIAAYLDVAIVTEVTPPRTVARRNPPPFKVKKEGRK